MRVVGYIEHPVLKITLFKMHNKFAVKFERDLLEQTFKFRTGHAIQDLSDVRRLVDQAFIDAVERHFSQMMNVQQTAFQRLLPDTGNDQFDEIV